MKHYLVINPNTNALTTERLQKVLSPLMPRDMKFLFTTASFGANYIACEASYAVASHACIEAWASQTLANPEPLAGVLIACFGDPALFALREMSAVPVTGLAEASFIQAAQTGHFAVVTGGERWKPMIQRLASNLGFGDHLRHIETVTPSGSELQAKPEMAIQCLGEACRRAAKDGVRVIILGGAGLAGYAEKLQPFCPLPLIDSARAGLEVLLNHQAPRAKNFLNGSYAQWSGMSGSLSQVNAFDLT